MEPITEQEIDRIAGNTGKALRAKNRVSIVIPEKAGGNPPWEGGLNGHFFRIRRGVPVEVPESLAELIRQNEAVTEAARESVRIYATGRGKRLG